MIADILLDGETAVGIVGSLCAVIVTLIVYVYQTNRSANNARIKTLETNTSGVTHERIKGLEDKTAEIVTNYLERFAQVNKNISETKDEINANISEFKAEILEKIHELHLLIIRK